MTKRSFGKFSAALVCALAVFAAVIGLSRARHADDPLRKRADAIVSQKGDAREQPSRRRAETGIDAGEERGPDSSPDVEAYLERAYPAADIPIDATLAAQDGWASLDAGPHSAGQWQLIGASKATQPGVLDVLGDGAQYVTSGRVTAMAIGPTCVPGACPVYVGAAGGGIWKTADALDGQHHWEFLSGSFATNAIGSLLVDPNDATGQTIYAGTGEPNVSVDSEAGMGIYKSIDGGETWSRLPGSVAASSNFRGRSVASLAIAPDGSLLVAVARGIRGYSSVPGGTTSNPPASTLPAAFGVYRSSDGGASFTNLTPGAFGSVRGINQVAVDPSNGATYYAAVLGAGVWRTTDAGASWTQIKNPLNMPNNANNTDRSAFAIVNDGGQTRMYVGQGASGGPHARVYRANNAQTATNTNFADLTTPQNVGYCDPQCWYDNAVYSPAGSPNIVYVLGAFDYTQRFTGGGASNGRAVLLSTDGGLTWSDLSQDSTPRFANATHPDQHAIVVNPGNPYQYWEGSDGGVVRSDGQFADVSYKCNQRGLSAADVTYCMSLLWRVPNQLSSLNNSLSTLQFQSLSVSAKNPLGLAMGGTQDNGTFQYNGSPIVWPQVMYGDGGQSGFSAANDALRVNTFTGQFNDANFRNGQQTKWVIISWPIFSSPESSYFYPPVVADPNALAGQTIFEGSFSVWRTQDWGGNQASLEANCSEFTSSGTGCGDFVRIGPVGATNLTASSYGSRSGGAVAAIARSTAANNTGTLWVATGAGRVFISDNADAAASSVAFTRIDNLAANSPGRFVSGIYVDPTNPHHAWISYSGYNVNTPSQPGHVFDVSWNGASTATWTDISHNLPDLPATAIVSDSVTGDLYVASDFGVMRLASGATTWTVAGSGLPMVEVPGLTIVPSARVLYAATHGRSAWMLSLP